MGFDESPFANVMTSIIDADPSPDLKQVYSRVIREERRLPSSKTRKSAEVIGFATRGEFSGPELQVDSVGGKNRDRLLYSHCSRSEHEKAFCWKLTGYLEWVTNATLIMAEEEAVAVVVEARGQLQVLEEHQQNSPMRLLLIHLSFQTSLQSNG